MMIKTGAWLAISFLAVATLLWPVSAKAVEPWEACFVEYDECVSRANEEPVDWIRDYSIQACESRRNTCLWENGW